MTKPADKDREAIHAIRHAEPEGGKKWRAAGRGVLLALMGERGAWHIVASSMLAVLLFAGLWNCIFWSFLGEYASYFELSMSNPFILLVLPRCVLILITTVPFGLLGTVVASILLPNQVRPRRLSPDSWRINSESHSQ
jgi:hypothetical protein